MIMIKQFINLLFIIIILGTIFVPYAINNTHTYTGIMFNVVDVNTYFSYMEQAKEGNLLFTNMYTSENIPSVIFNPFWLFLGLLSIFSPTIWVYHLINIILLVIFVYLVNIIADLVNDDFEKTLIVIFVLFGSGLGYLFRLLTLFGFKHYGSIDQWINGSNAISLNLAPIHAIASVCLMIIIFKLYYEFWNTKKSLKYQLFLGVLIFFLGFIHLFDVITLGLTFGIYMLYMFITHQIKLNEMIKNNLFVGIIAVIPFIYTFYLYSFVLSDWNSQNVLASPKILHVLLGYAIPMFFILVHLINKFITRKKYYDYEVLLYFWILSSILLMYSPFNIQRRFIEGLFVPVMILAAIGFTETIIPYIGQLIKGKSIIIISTIVVVLLLMPSSFLWLYDSFNNLTSEVSDNLYIVPNYLSANHFEALQWLRENVNSREVVLARYWIGNYIPRYVNSRVYLGHWAQTINFEEKNGIVNDFFEDRRILPDDIDYIYCEPKLFSCNFEIRRVYSNDEVIIFGVDEH